MAEVAVPTPWRHGLRGYLCDFHLRGCVFTDQSGFNRVGRAAPAEIQRAQDEREWRRFGRGRSQQEQPAHEAPWLYWPEVAPLYSGRGLVLWLQGPVTGSAISPQVALCRCRSARPHDPAIRLKAGTPYSSRHLSPDLGSTAERRRAPQSVTMRWRFPYILRRRAVTGIGVGACLTLSGLPSAA